MISVFDFHVGHDQPESKGGTLDVNNLKPICARCNLSMSDKYTIEEWNKYRSSYKTLFVDLDGVLVYNSGEYTNPKWGDTKPICENVEYLKKLYNTKRVKIIITTARKSKYRVETINQLKRNFIPYDDIIFDLYHAKRYLINDYSHTNSYPTAISVNLKRDSGELNKLLN